jgi:putative tricarboxylic transport membrane protein
MGLADRLSGVVLLVFAALMAYFAWKLPLGTFQRPGPGFFPLLLSFVLGPLALLLLISSLVALPAKKEEKAQPHESDLRKIFYILGSLLVYAFCFDKLGFLISTFLFFLLLKPLIQRSWGYVVGGSLLVTGVSYLIFDTLLQSQLPRGIFGF